MEHVTLGEGRASLALLERLAAHPDAHGFLTICLEDNEAWSGAVAKGRSPAFAVNQLLRRRTALCLATGIEFIQPWIDTARQPADSLSRLRA